MFINKTLSTETAYQQDLINRDLLSTRLIVGKVGPGTTVWCDKFNSTSNVLDNGLINSWLISKSPYQQLVVDKELIVDKVVLINKDP